MFNDHPPLSPLPSREGIRARAHALTVQRFGRVMQLYTPLYLSNECIDTCLYCGFSRTNKIARKTLTVEEVLKEAQFLIDEGFQHLLLVSGEHPKKVSIEYLSAIALQLRPRISSIKIEVAPFFDAESYRTLAAAGIDGVVIYQETYNREISKKMHVGGPKQDFDRRLQAVEAACEAGIRSIGIGVLLGLSDWREEIVALVHHAKHLMKKYWRTEVTLSLPRLKPCASGFQPLTHVTDQALEEIICQLRLQLPEAGIILSTRERPEFRNRLIKMGVTHMSAGSRTEPGGYTQPDEAGKQFELEDHRSVPEVVQSIIDAGYEPVFKDWETSLFG